VSEVSVSSKLLHNSNKNLLQINAMPVVEASLTLSFLYQYQYVCGSKPETWQCFAWHSIDVSDLTCFIVENVAHSHTFIAFMCFWQWRTEKIFMGFFIQWHMVVIFIWCALFVTSQFDVVFIFPNQRFGEVCWHNMHIRLHALPLIYVSLNW